MLSKRFVLLSSLAVSLAAPSIATANTIVSDTLPETQKSASEAVASEKEKLKTAALATPLPSAEKATGIEQAEEPKSELSIEPKAETEVPNVTDELPETATDKVDTSPQKSAEELAAEQAAQKKERLARALEKASQEDLKKGNQLTRKDRKAIAAFYEEHNFELLWFDDGVLTDDAQALLNRLSKAEEDGLNASDYAVEIPLERGDEAVLAATEIKLSEALLKYARHAQAGRIFPSRVSKTFKVRPVYPDPKEVLVKLATSSDKASALASYHPPHPAYKALRKELSKLRSITEVKKVTYVPEGKTMALGSKGKRVGLLRERLNVSVLADEDVNTFDETLKSAVKAFQTENNLIADGIVGPRTLRVMNEGNVTSRIPDIIANMERWRWMARDFGDFHIVANIPSFEVVINKDHRPVHRTRTVVGKTRHKTPIFSDKMEFVVVNPYWNVPFSIASKELLPKIQANPNFVASRNYEVLKGSRVVNPTSVNWDKNSFRRLRIRQRPGARNALGNVKFLFPNDYAIYFHDTPSKNLFQRAARAFSHGCVRIHNPFEFGDAIMKHAKNWKAGRLENMVGGKEKWIKLRKDEQIPVHITYFTTVVDETGKVSYKSDLYGHNTRLKRELGLI